MFEAVFLPTARAQRDLLYDAERAGLEQVIHFIETDPWVDIVLTFPLLVGSVVLSLYEDRRWLVSYRVVDNRFVEIYAIARTR